MKNPFIIPSIIIAAAILGGFWMLKPQSELKPPSEPQEAIVIQKPDISIHDAAYEGNIEAVKQHLAAGTDVNAKDKEGDTPLHIATWNSHWQIAQLLITKGADVNAQLDDGRTPLDLATEKELATHSSLTVTQIIRHYGGKTGKELKAAEN